MAGSERERERRSERSWGDIFSSSLGENGSGWEERSGMRRKGRKSRRAVTSCRPMAAWEEQRRKEFFPLPYLSLPPSFSGCVTCSVSPFGFNQADSWFDPFQEGGDLSSAGINLCDRGLLDESDHPCWLAQWMEPTLAERGGWGESHTVGRWGQREWQRDSD